MEHVDSVNLDQIKLRWYGRSHIHWGIAQFLRETPCREVVALMGGAQVEEAQQEYKEMDGSHCGHDWIIILLMVC